MKLKFTKGKRIEKRADTKEVRTEKKQSRLHKFKFLNLKIFNKDGKFFANIHNNIRFRSQTWDGDHRIQKHMKNMNEIILKISIIVTIIRIIIIIIIIVTIIIIDNNNNNNNDNHYNGNDNNNDNDNNSYNNNNNNYHGNNDDDNNSNDNYRDIN